MKESSLKKVLALQLLAVLMIGGFTVYISGEISPLLQEKSKLEATVSGLRLEKQGLDADILSLKNKLDEDNAKIEILKSDIEAFTEVAQPANISQPVDSWIYIGRVNSDGQWAPISEKIENFSVDIISAGVDKKAIHIVKPTRIVADPRKSSIDHSADQDHANKMVLLLKQASTAQIVEFFAETSAGKAQNIWARVEVDPVDIIEVRAE